MGQEIGDSQFQGKDFATFAERLRAETELLARWFREGAFAETESMGGFELEAWLVDAHQRPAPINEEFLARLNSPLVVPELATFNVELNGSPQNLHGNALSRLAGELQATWDQCNRVAAELGARLAMIGILPTVSLSDLNLRNMSPLKRYRALNEQVLRLRKGRPLELDIQGRDHLRRQHHDVMLESAATSFQIHLKVNPAEAAAFYNASKIVSAPMVAVSANSPYLCGQDLWAESRIPLFEQSVSVGASEYTSRVSFGVRYARESVMEIFAANLERFPVLLPHLMDESPETLSHLRLHNGTLWRWNRPLIGFGADGSPHLRIEHRVVPAGPSVIDAIANAALYFGSVHALVDEDGKLAERLPFLTAKENFYQAARHGLDAELEWLDGRRLGVSALLDRQLVPAAERALAKLGVDAADIQIYLGVIRGRLRSGQNGAAWQRAYVARHGPDMQALTGAYLERQDSGVPVHEWSV